MMKYEMKFLSTVRSSLDIEMNIEGILDFTSISSILVSFLWFCFFLSNLNIHIVPIWLGDEGDRYWSSQLTVNNSICMSTMYICHVFYVLGTVSRVSRVPWRVIPAVTLGFSLNLAKIIVNHHVKIITTRAHYLLLI